MSQKEQIKSLRKELAECMQADRFRLKRQLDRLTRELRSGKDLSEQIGRLAVRIDQSRLRKLARKASVPAFEYPDLPVSAKKDEIVQLIRNNQVVIVCGETGSGKTTQLPKICLEAGRGQAGFIGHTQPRRIAARTVADRIAEELGEKVGQSVGYKVRFHDKTHESSLIKLMTDGILLAESQNDRFLNQYDTLIIDEAHERSLNIDFLLGYLKWLLPKRPDLKLIITSATIDPQRFAKHFDDAPIIEVSGRTYPVEIRYRPIELIEEDDETSADVQQGIVEAGQELQRDMPGDILVFLRGEREIKEATDSLGKHFSKSYQILPLYSKLSVREQEQIFKPGGKPRIVLATNVAETSLTVPGIRSVIDTGHARISRYSPRSKIQRLPIEKISQASANQRAGRCGRVAPGICIRLYSEEDFQNRPLFTEPEILRTNLSSVILQMSHLKLGEIEQFPFVEPPEAKMIRDGKQVLHEVNALDKAGRLTDTGRRLAKIPADPRLARMLLAADKYNCLTETAIIVAGLSIQDPREKPSDKLQQAESKHAAFRHEHSDFLSFLNLWQHFEDKKKHLSNNKLRKYCRDNFLSYVRMREWHDIHSQIMQVIKGELKLRPNQVPASYDEIHKALLPGLLSNIGFRHEQYEYLGARNLKFFIFPGSGQHKARPKWIMAAEQVETSKVYARTVAKIEPEWIEQAARHLIKRSYYDPHWEKKAGRSAVYERTLLYGITLQAKRKIPYERVDPKGAREIFIRCGLVAQDYHTHAPFFKANQKLLEEVGYIQHKGRRVDLIEDEEWLYQFYDKKLPETVVNGITLDQWRKKVEKDNPKILFLTKEDLTRGGDEHVDEWNFPDVKKIGDLSIKLDYRFEPGHADDGVTAIVPVHQLNQLNATPFDWLVPGMLEEKLTALVKALPKQLRKHFVPVPETVKRCLEIEPDFKGSLYQWLSDRLRKLTGESVPLNEWRPEVLAEHLHMNFRVVDEAGRILGSGRNLKTLQVQFAETAGDSFDELAADELNFTGCIDWPLDEIPETWSFIQNGQSFLGFPALVDEGETVGVKMFDTREKAGQAHVWGLNKLFQLKCRKSCQYLKKNIPVAKTVPVLYGQLPRHPLLGKREGGDFKQEIVYAVIREVFLADSNIRSAAQFEQVLQQGKTGMVDAGNRLGQSLDQIMALLPQIRKFLKQPCILHDTREDIEQQLALLLYQGFIRYTPMEQIRHIVRYLKAILMRLEKQKNEAQNLAQLQRYWLRYWGYVEKQAEKNQLWPEQDKFRWALEEFRVSLFAQQLKTAYPVSAKRLDKLWDES